jgi:hypothetical protein
LTPGSPPAQAFDPDAFIDRVNERDLFNRLLRLEGPARVITIKDGKDKGKSELLRLLHFYCEHRDDVPCALVALDEHDHVHEAVHYIARELRAWGIALDSFREAERRRLDATAPNVSIDIDGTVDADAISGGRQAGAIVGDINVNAGAIDEDSQEDLRGQAVEAFAQDLCAAASEKPVVLLFDGFEKSGRELERWLPRFLKARVFDADGRAEKLIVVIAGQTVPTPAMREHLKETYDDVVWSLDQLSLWARDDVIAFLERNGFAGRYDDEDVDWIHAKLRKGWTIGQALDVLSLTPEGRA